MVQGDSPGVVVPVVTVGKHLSQSPDSRQSRGSRGRLVLTSAFAHPRGSGDVEEVCSQLRSRAEL